MNDLDRMHRSCEDALHPICGALETLNLDAVRHHAPESIEARHAQFVRIEREMRQLSDRYLAWAEKARR